MLETQDVKERYSDVLNDSRGTVARKLQSIHFDESVLTVSFTFIVTVTVKDSQQMYKAVVTPINTQYIF